MTNHRNQHSKPDLVERGAGSLITQGVTAAIAAADGGVTAVLLPVLATTLASDRQKKRVDLAIASLNSDLEKISTGLKNISDNQYKLINEIVLTVFQTTCDEKIQYLRNAVFSAVIETDLKSQETYQLSRVLRDISAAEIQFLTEHFQYEGVLLLDAFEQIIDAVQKPEYKSILQLMTHSAEGKVVTGLINIGMLIQTGTRYTDVNLHKFSPICGKLITLVSKPNSQL
jgi:hypothetical protein